MASTSSSSSLPSRFITGVTYWPVEMGPYLWHDFPADQVRADLISIRSQGFDTVRVLLGWDAFMPSDRGVHPQRLAELGMMLDAAAEQSIRLVPVVFAQSLGDCIALPAYAVDPAAARPGVRVVCAGRVRRGGPRDLYTDPLMRELAGRWMEALLAAFARHPALAAWDLGHDPATTMRPQRFADLPAWAGAMAEQVHAAGDACWLTLGAADLLNARGVRLGPLAGLVDALGVNVLPQTLRLADDPLDVDAVLFLTELARRFAGEPGLPVIVTTGVASTAGEAAEATAEEAPQPGRRRGGAAPSRWDAVPVEPPVAAAHATELLGRLPQGGAAGTLAWTWAGAGPRPRPAPPFDRLPSLGRCGLVDAVGRLTPAGCAWQDLADRDLEAGPDAPWTLRLDEEDYYRNLPESALDTFVSWRDAR